MSATMTTEARVGAPQGQKALSRRGLRGHGRAAVLWGLGLFVLSQVGLLAYIERRGPELRDPTFEVKYRLLTRRLAACPERPVTVICLGSSMTANGMNTGLLEGLLAQALNRPVVAFNLGFYSSGWLSQHIHLGRLLHRGVRPDLVVIELSPLVLDDAGVTNDLALFAGSRLEGREVALVRRYTTDPDLVADRREALLVPVYGHRLAILNCEAQFLVPFGDRLYLWVDADAHGWAKAEYRDPKDRPEALAAMAEATGPRFANFQVNPTARQMLTDLLACAQQEGVPALLVRMPEGPRLRSLYGPGLDEELMKEFAALSRRYDFPLVNARDWLGEDLLTDSIHATGEGAEVLTRRLGKAMVPLLARRLYAPGPPANAHASRAPAG